MALIENTLFGIDDKVANAISIMKQYEPIEGYNLGFSGGKDSVVIKALADIAKIKYTAVYNVTTVDPPELVRFIKYNFTDVIWSRAKLSFLKMLVKKKCPPLRHRRWCCELYKEKKQKGTTTIVGVRWEESARRRSKWKIYNIFGRPKTVVICPIVDWNEADVWEFIEGNSLKYCSLYDEGFSRLGCVFCPMTSAGQKRKERLRWPVLEAAFRKAFYDIWEVKPCYDLWNNAEEYFEWWMGDKSSRKEDISLFEKYYKSKEGV